MRVVSSASRKEFPPWTEPPPTRYPLRPLIARDLGDVVLVGSSHCAGTLRVREFLTRNGHPYTTIDLDRDPGVQSLLDHFHVAAADVPVLMCRGSLVLRNPTNREIADCLGFNAAVARSATFARAA